MSLDIRPIGTANLPDAARLCLAGRSLSDRPRAFTREVEMEATRCKLSYLRGAMAKGARALAAYRAGMLVGYVEAHAVEEALIPVEGSDVHLIGCLRVPEEAERAEVEYELVESLARQLAPRGLAVLARDKMWTPLKFEEVARDASEVEAYDRVLWWRAAPGQTAAPKIAPVQRKIPRIEGKVRVDLFTSDRCPWDRYVHGLTRDVCATLKGEVVVYETDCSRRREVLRSGVTSAIAINGRFQPWFRPFRLPDEHVIRRTIESAV